MAGKLGKYQMTTPYAWKGLTHDSHLTTAFGGKPQLLANTIVHLLANQGVKYMDTFFTANFTVKELDSDDDYTWRVMGSARRNIPLVEARNESGSTVTAQSGMIGVGTQPFYLVFGEDWFGDGEVIVGNLNEKYPLRILEEPRLEGVNAVYKVELMGGNTAGIPAERLLAGELFSKEYAPVETEGSRKVGTTRHATTTEMRNEWTTLRKSDKVYGNKIGKQIGAGIPVLDPTTGASTVKDMWMDVEEWQYFNEWTEEKSTALVWGRSNRTEDGEYLNFGKSGNVIRQGAGFMEQLEYGNTYYYDASHFSLNLLEKALYTAVGDGKLPFNQRTFILNTGERGAVDFHKAVLSEASGWSFKTVANLVGAVAKTTSPLHSNALKAGFQFTEFYAPNGVVVKLNINPAIYDDPVRNKVRLADGSLASSHRFDIWDIGTMEQPNIYKVINKNSPELLGYQAGFRNPWTGQQNNQYMSFDEDAAVMHTYAQFGAAVLDPTRTMSFIPNVLG